MAARIQGYHNDGQPVADWYLFHSVELWIK